MNHNTQKVALDLRDSSDLGEKQEIAPGVMAEALFFVLQSSSFCAHLGAFPHPLALARAFPNVQANDLISYRGKSAEARRAAREAKTMGITSPVEAEHVPDFGHRVPVSEPPNLQTLPAMAANALTTHLQRLPALEAYISQPPEVHEEPHELQHAQHALPAAERVAPTLDRQVADARLQLAIDSAAASAADVLLSGDCDLNAADVAKLIAGFSAKVSEILPRLPSSGGRPSGAPAAAAPAPAAAAPRRVDKEALTQALLDFVESDYPRRLCDELRVQALIGSPRHVRIGIMFEKLKVTDAKLEFTFHRPFEPRSARLLEYLVKHLRARKIPELKQLQYECRSPPSTRTMVV